MQTQNVAKELRQMCRVSLLSAFHSNLIILSPSAKSDSVVSSLLSSKKTWQFYEK